MKRRNPLTEEEEAISEWDDDWTKSEKTVVDEDRDLSMKEIVSKDPKFGRYGNPPSLIVYISNEGDHEVDGTALICIEGEGAKRLAKHLQSFRGSLWETDGNNFAYTVAYDDPDLVEEVVDEINSNLDDSVEWDVNLDEYYEDFDTEDEED